MRLFNGTHTHTHIRTYIRTHRIQTHYKRVWISIVIYKPYDACRDRMTRVEENHRPVSKRIYTRINETANLSVARGGARSF